MNYRGKCQRYGICTWKCFNFDNQVLLYIRLCPANKLVENHIYQLLTSLQVLAFGKNIAAVGSSVARGFATSGKLHYYWQ